jgi:hypothetical protein
MTETEPGFETLCLKKLKTLDNGENDIHISSRRILRSVVSQVGFFPALREEHRKSVDSTMKNVLWCSSERPGVSQEHVASIFRVT